MKKPTSLLRHCLLPALLFVLACVAGPDGRAAEVMPAPPTRYFNDYAHVVSPATADRLNLELENLEKQSSNQILVAIYPTMQTDSSLDDYCYRITASWHVGQKGKDNGAVLFVFIKERKAYIETRPGLEGALPDAVCKDIVSDVLGPKLLQTPPDYDGGLTAGVEAMIKATRGEYKGNGHTADQDQNQNGGGIGIGGIILLVVGAVIFITLCFVFPGFMGGLANTLMFFFNIASMFSGGGGRDYGGGSSSGGGWSSGGGSSSGGGGGAGGDW